jgi:hypothetical protein
MTRLAILLFLSGVIAWPLAFATTTVQDTMELTATVKDVDLPDRLVILQRPDGSVAVVAVDPSIRRLDEIRAGDKVHVKYSRAMAVKILKSKATQLSTTITPSFQRSEGAFPGATASRQIRAVVRIDGIDLVNYSVTITDQSGESEIVYLSEPQLRNNLIKLKLGDIVEIVYTEATAISVSPADDL